MNYYDYNEEEIQSCPNGCWTGKGKDGSAEYFDQLYTIACPKCDTTIWGIEYPTAAETKAAAEKGIKKGLDNLPTVLFMESRQENFEKVKLKSIDQLPEIIGDNLDFIWDDKENVGKFGSDILILYNNVVLWREPAFYECWWRFNEIKAILEAKYSSRFHSLTPTLESELDLYGDDISSPNKISFGPSNNN